MTERLQADRDAALQLTPVSRETVQRLEVFVALLLRWQKAVPLLGASTLPKLWTRHVADSLQLLDVAGNAKVWADLGSGAGFPGLIIAIARANQSGMLVHLVESNSRKVAFLREAIRVTSAPAKIHAMRIESAAKRIGEVEIITARALAPLPRLIQLAAPLFEGGARGIFLKSQYVDRELTEATKSWNIQATILPSRTDSRGRIVILDRVTSLKIE
jgi:16S rRNA (guanine527-N7)-methyltransferase